MADFRFKPAHRKHIEDVLSGVFVSPFSKVREFEEKFAGIHGIKHATFVNSGTDALRLSLLAMKEFYGWKDGDRVLVPAVTFVATVNIVLQAGLEPVLVDVGMTDFGLNAWPYLPTEKRFTGLDYESKIPFQMPENVRAVIVVHVAGQMADMDPIMEMAKIHDLKVIEDSCETMFASYKGRGCGTYGDVACFSTYVAHLITTGAGGLACSNSEALTKLIRSYANHGRNTDYIPPHYAFASERLENAIVNRFRFDRIGYSCRSTELDAAIGCGELEGWQESVRARRAVARKLSERLAKHWGRLYFQEEPHDRTHHFMFFPVVLKEGSNVDRHRLMVHLERRGIETRTLLPVLNQPCYAGRFRREDFPVASYLLDNAFYIPCRPDLSEEGIETVGEAFDEFLADGLTKSDCRLYSIRR